MQISAEPTDAREIGVLLFERFSNHCLANAVEPLRAANGFAGRPLYRWQYLTLDGQPVASSSGLPVAPGGRLADHPGGDYLFVIPSYGHLDHVGAATARALRGASHRFRFLVGMDMGAWLMAAAGLLEGRRATIHWDELDRFSEAFPDIEVTEDRFVLDGDRITCGGATTAFELVLDLIARHHGPMLRLEVAALFMYGERRDLDDPLLRPSRSQLADAAVALMRRHIEEPLGVPALCRRLGVPQKRLEALFRDQFRMTPQTVYKRLRLREAKRLVAHSRLSVTEIGLRCGYRDASAMTRAFAAEFGVTPRDLRASLSR